VHTINVSLLAIYIYIYIVNHYLVLNSLESEGSAETNGLDGRGATYLATTVVSISWCEATTSSPFGWLVAGGWCWFVLREEYCWLFAGGWFVVREKYCCLVADKPSDR
jgi:hypothetical protein